MRIKSVIIENFRGYKSRQIIELSDLTAFVGKNDVGKSTVLEALDIFFNEGKGVIAMDSSDVNVNARNEAALNIVDIIIGVSFTDLPSQVVLDENNSTTLSDEYLIDDNDCLTVLKKYPNAGKPKVYIYAKHPTHVICCDLLAKKQTDLRRLSSGLDCDHNINASMRSAIRNKHINELKCAMTEIDASKEDAKNIWEALKVYMPVYSLFQADRSNGDKDKEIQDPLKEAVKLIMNQKSIRNKCQEIYNSVMSQLQSVSDRTLEKIHEMNPQLANTLHPSMPSNTDLKWMDVFKNVSITGDNDIPINKRGSGVKRMILLNFFRAEAEKSQHSVLAPGIVYAIEEPETAQHVIHQKLLINSLKQLSHSDSAQVIITTHSSTILKEMDFENIRLVVERPSGKCIEKVTPSLMPNPSLNEIAYTSFGESSTEYYDELYGFIFFKGWFNDYKQGKSLIPYIKEKYDGSTYQKNITLTEKIRHQIHHPENHHNDSFTQQELEESIKDMRAYIESKRR